MTQEGTSPIRDVREADGVVSVALAGSLCGDGSTKVLLDAIHEIEARGSPRLVLDLAKLERIDSAGLGAVASVYVSVTRVSGKLVLAGASPRVQALLSTTMLLQVIPLYPDAESARRSLLR
ncbi:MAG: STAS domain-containing protein [Acidobacteriia bacterium]|nr:STAS domain-containing protein [Terriglobia bacterium]